MSFLELSGQGLGWLWRASWQGAVLVLLVLGVQRLLRARLTPPWRFALWWLVLARLLLPVAPESAWSLFNLAQLAPAAPVPAILPDVAPRKDTAVSIVPALAEADGVTPAQGLSPLRREPAPARAARTAAPPAAQSVRSEHSRTLLAWAGVLWLLGAFAYGGRLAVGSALLARRLRNGAPVTDAPILQVLEQCRREIGVARAPELVATSAVESPALFGLFRCRLLVPLSMVAWFSPEEWRHVLLHELAHVRRRDVQVNWLMVALQTLHWFNPLVWLAFHRMRADRELACDAAALACARDDEAPAYGRTILKLVDHLSRPSMVPGLVGILEDKSQIQQRILMIAGFRKARRWPILAGLLLAVLGVFALTDARSPSPTTPQLAQAKPATPTDRAPDAPGTDVAGPVTTNAAVSSLIQDGRALYEAGQLSEAEAKFEQARRTDPKNAVAKYYSSLVKEARFKQESTRRAASGNAGATNRSAAVPPPTGAFGGAGGASPVAPLSNGDTPTAQVTFEARLFLFDLDSGKAPEPGWPFGSPEAPKAGVPRVPGVPARDSAPRAAANPSGVFPGPGVPADTSANPSGVFPAGGATPPYPLSLSAANPSGVFPGPGVPADTSANPSGVFPAPGTTAEDPQALGILAPDQMRNVHRALVLRPDGEYLSAPRVTTLSGRPALLELGDNCLEIEATARVGARGYELTIDLTVRTPVQGEARLRLPREIRRRLSHWDGQTIVLTGSAPREVAGGKLQRVRYALFLTAQLVDAAGNRVHSDKDLPYDPNSLPPARVAPKPMTAPGAAETSERAQRLSRLERIVIPAFPTDSGSTQHTLREVLIELAELARAHDPEHEGVNFVIDRTLSPTPGTNAAPRTLGDRVRVRISPPLRSVSLSQVLETIVNCAQAPEGDEFRGLEYRLEEYAVIFAERGPQRESSLSKVFRVDPNTFAQTLEAVRPQSPKAASTNAAAAGPPRAGNGAPSSAMQETVRQFFTRATGVNFGGAPTAGPVTNAPMTAGEPGVTKSSTVRPMFFNERTGILFVRATAAELDLVEQAVQVLNIAPAQVNLSVKLYLIDPENAPPLSLPWTLIGRFPGTNPAPGGSNPTNAIPTATAGMRIGTLPAATGPSGSPLNGVLSETQWRQLDMALMNAGRKALLAPNVTTLSARQAQISQPGSYTLDVLPTVSADQQRIQMRLSLEATPEIGEEAEALRLPPIRLSTSLVVFDGQTAVLGGTAGEVPAGNGKPARKLTYLLCVTPTLIDPAGNRIHGGEELPAPAGTIPSEESRVVPGAAEKTEAPSPSSGDLVIARRLKLDPATLAPALEAWRHSPSAARGETSPGGLHAPLRAGASPPLADLLRQYLERATGIDFGGAAPAQPLNDDALTAQLRQLGEARTARPMYYNESQGILVVHATAAELDSIQRALRALHTGKPK